MSLLDQAGGVCGPGQVLRDGGSQELEAGDTFNNHPVNVDGVMRASFLLPEVHNELLCFTGVKEQVIVSAPCGQVLYLFPVGSLIVVTDEANHRGVVCKLNDGVASMHRLAVMGVEGVEKWAQHTALWYANVKCDGGGAGVARPNMLRPVGQKVHDPVAEGGVNVQVSKFCGQLGGNDSVKC